MSVLRHQMTEDMAVRGLAQSTQQAYLKAVERLALHYGQRPDRLSSRDIQRFVLHLHEVEGLSWSTCNSRYARLEACIKKGIDSRLGGEHLCLSHCGYTSWRCCILPT